jgi:hypothetical protein
MMMSMILGREFMGKPFIGQTPKFLIVDLDMGAPAIKKHLLNVAESLDLRREDIGGIEERIALYCDGTYPLPYGFDFGDEKVGIGSLRRVLADVDPDIVIVESWSDICGTAVDMDSNNAVNAAIRHLRSYGEDAYQWWLIHHEGKAKHDSTKARKLVQHRGIGAQALGKAAHRNFSITHQRRDGNATINRVEWGKIRLGERPTNFEYAFGKGPDGRFRMRYMDEVHE